MIKRQATLRDVAAAAAVSTATVSKFVNGTQRFSPEVEARIKASIAQLGYQSNPLARGMITGQTGAVGVVILDIRNPHFTAIVKGANRVAMGRGYNLLFVDTEESQSPERQLLETLSRRVDGLIVSSRLPEESIAWLAELGKPVVFFGRLGRLGIHSVGSDGYRAAFMLGRHLVELGHRDVAYVGFKAARWNQERLRGLNDALSEVGSAARVFEVNAPSAEAGERIASQVLLGPDRPHAVVAYNDLVALGLMSEARSLGVRVPEDVSIAGFDDIAYGRYASPSLTTVDMQSERMGDVAMQRLLEAINGELAQPFDEILEPRLVPRASTRRRA
jgi:DNA-binding LacI/PurR family transcriptional regulator